MGLDVGSLKSDGTLEITGETQLDSKLKFNSDYGSATQVYGIRAWLNYDHAADEINGSANVSSCTDNATGKFTINWHQRW